MSHDPALARSERNQALIDAMLMAASADGEVSATELQTLIRRVIERPEFEGTRPEELNALVESSAARLSRTRTLDKVMVTLRDRLPDHKNRLLAFGLAASVAFSDRRATREELGLLKSFQMGLGISEDEVQQIITAVEAGRSLAEVLGEEAERLFAEVMVLVSVSDGRVDAPEAEAMVETLAGDPIFRSITSDRARLFVRDAMQSLAIDGMPSRLTVMARGLSTHGQRLKAYSLAAKVAKAGQKRGELKMLELLQATFGLADDEVARLKAQA